MMTFKEFQATGRDCDDLAAATASDFGDEGKLRGRLYLDSLYIDDTDSWDGGVHPLGRWHLLLERDEWFSNDLAKLELRLYRWALRDGHIDGIDEIVEDALNAACARVQEHAALMFWGTEANNRSGDLAANFFSGPHHVKDSLASYVLAELTQGE